MTDKTVFPDPSYKETVLAPLFEGTKAHFVDAVRAINQAHLVMLKETGIVGRDDAKLIAHALRDIDEQLDIDTLEYTGEFEDYFFLVEAELKKRLGADVAGALHTARSRNDMDHTVFKIVLTNRVGALVKLGHALAGATDRFDVAMIAIADLGTVLEQDSVALPVEAVRQDDLALGAHGDAVDVGGAAHLVVHLQEDDLPF